MVTIRLHNSKTRQREVFAPIDPENVRIYVCGPTVYDRAHLGNARPVVVFDVATGGRRLILHGPTVTARRTAAVSLLAAQHLATRRDGPMLIVGAGVQGRAHLEAFREGLGVQEVWVSSRSSASADALVAGLIPRYADKDLGLARLTLLLPNGPL